MFKSVFLLISAIASSSALCWKLAHSPLKALSFADSGPNTFRSCSKENALSFRPTVKPEKMQIGATKKVEEGEAL
jgi:hypothetical protein